MLISKVIQATKLNYNIISTLSGLREFLTTECSLKIMENAFYFILKALFFLSWLFGYVEKQLEQLDQYQNLWRHNLDNKQL